MPGNEFDHFKIMTHNEMQNLKVNWSKYIKKSTLEEC